ncbi:hypothetical protein [Methylobacterium radiotolerans]|nr:hypothetical protein [Methylobacterium radiotolerans]
MARLMMRPPSHAVWVDVTVGLTAGLVATLVTNLAQRPLRWITPERVDRHEKRVRPGASSSLVAAQKLCAAMDVDPTPHRHKISGKAIHLATGMGWGPVYGLLRRYAGLRPFTAALTCGTAMSLILDEYLVPTLGLSAPNHHYPTFTRIRGLAAHLVYGSAVAIVAEGLGRSLERSPAYGARHQQSPVRGAGG